MQSQKRLEEVAVQIRDVLGKLSKCEKKSQRQTLIKQAQTKTQQLKECIELLPQFHVHRKRLEGELKRINQVIQRQIEKNQNYDDSSQSFVRNVEKPPMTEKQSSRLILTKMIEIEMDPMKNQIQPEEIEKIADQMEQNYEIMKDIQELVHKGGENLDVITEETLQTLQKVKEAKEQIIEADRAQLQGIMLKVRMGIGSILGLIGAKIFGVAGGVAGFFTGFFGFK